MATKKMSATKKKKSKKMDRKLQSNQKHEIKHTAKVTGKSQKAVRAAKAKVGRSRKAVINELKKS